MTLSEQLIALFLSISLSVALLATLPYISKWNQNIKTKITTKKKTLQIDSLLHGLVRTIDHHRYPFFPIIHNDGVITHKDGTLTSLSKRKDYLSPDHENDAFSILLISTNKPIRVKEHSKEICLQKGDSKLKNSFDAIAYTADKRFEISATLRKSTHQSCRPITISIPLQSIFFEQPHDSSVTPRIKWILPIDENITHYVSKQKTLRYVQFRGDEVVENQPVVEQAPSFQLRSQVKENIYWLTLNLLQEKKRIYSETYTHHLSRLPEMQILFQGERT